MPGVGRWLRGKLGTEESHPVSLRLNGGAKPSPQQVSAERGNAFALAMYRQLRRSSENLFFSPFSVRAGLGMAYAGARGETARQMRTALSMPPFDEPLDTAFVETILRLGALGGDCELALANALWGQDGDPVQPDYLDLIARRYQGQMNLVDFRTGAEAARVTINQWVEEKTRQRIRDLMPSGSLDAETRLVLANAVYFKGRWAVPFSEENTRDEPFCLEDGDEVQVPLMRKECGMLHMRAEGYQAIDLFYRGGGLSMLVVLPDRRDGLRDLEQRLSARMLHQIVEQMHSRQVKLFLPRFTFNWGTADICAALAALGMPLALTRFQADFSGINGKQPRDPESLFVSGVFHRAFVETNERGTEAAAATAILMLAATAARPSKPPEIPIFRADHPFLFAIRDRKSGAILFIGRMVDPTRES
jgi:serpin B